LASITGSGLGAGFFTSAGTGAAAGGSAEGGAETTAGAGAGDAAGVAGTTGFPQVSQNFAFGRSGAPHCTQTADCSTLAPHDSQNFRPGVSGLPHFEQVLFPISDVLTMTNLNSGKSVSALIAENCFATMLCTTLGAEPYFWFRFGSRNDHS
jgi:hypothetical protein